MSDDVQKTDHVEEDDGPNRLGLFIAIGVSVLFIVLHFLRGESEDFGLTIAYLIVEVTLVSIVIWQACDPFADAAQWVGQKLHLPGSVRGATLDAVASSMPELFSGIFFVLLALRAAYGGTPEALVEAGAEGYGSTIATCAGSAVYNMILIPAFCALTIGLTRKERPTIDVEDEVISRDGIWFVSCEMLLILFLFQNTMHWWMGLILLGLYFVYIYQLYRDAKLFRLKKAAIRLYLEEHGTEVEVGRVLDALDDQGISVSRGIVALAKEEIQKEISREELEEEEIPDDAGILFGYFAIPLSGLSTTLILAVTTLISAAACYFLVEATIETAEALAVPAFFVAVIVAAAASSVPDTLLAIGAAKRGDDSGAVSNAFGSNIFDICVCLSIPLLVNSYLTGWQPVALLQDGKPIAGLVGLRILLVVLTIITLLVMWHNRQLTVKKALFLCGLYGVFIAYAVLGSLGILF